MAFVKNDNYCKRNGCPGHFSPRTECPITPHGPLIIHPKEED